MFGRCCVWILLVICIKYGYSVTITERLSHFIFPGTNWCGIGNIAKNYDDLGTDRVVDMCCREHDMCPDEINAGKRNHGLVNNYFITRLHCRCDKKFYDCLKNLTTSSVANLIGHIYFNVLQYPCYAPLCTGNYVLPWGECPEKNNNITRGYQWYDVKPYKR